MATHRTVLCTSQAVDLFQGRSMLAPMLLLGVRSFAKYSLRIAQLLHDLQKLRGRVSSTGHRSPKIRGPFSNGHNRDVRRVLGLSTCAAGGTRQLSATQPLNEALRVERMMTVERVRGRYSVEALETDGTGLRVHDAPSRSATTWKLTLTRMRRIPRPKRTPDTTLRDRRLDAFPSIGPGHQPRYGGLCCVLGRQYLGSRYVKHSKIKPPEPAWRRSAHLSARSVIDTDGTERYDYKSDMWTGDVCHISGRHAGARAWSFKRADRVSQS